jgi:hypothetical protein
MRFFRVGTVAAKGVSKIKSEPNNDGAIALILRNY